MSGGSVCKCRPRNIEVLARKCNYSAFNGYRHTYSDYSLVRCLTCGHTWRTKASYVDDAPNAAITRG